MSLVFIAFIACCNFIGAIRCYALMLIDFVCFSQFDYKSICQRRHIHIHLSKTTSHFARCRLLDEIAQLCIAFPLIY